jgi:hypothetical protein
LGVLSLGLLALTVLDVAWIETVFRVDPDGGDDSLEWLVAAGLCGGVVAFSLLAWGSWRRVGDFSLTSSEGG